jgi:hypothetical protein
MAILAKPSRSYANVDHDPEGLSGAGSNPYSRKDGFKTYRPCEWPCLACFAILVVPG